MDWMDIAALDSYARRVANSPIFDPIHGFGGNGLYIPGYAGPFGNLSTLPGTGGGCLQDGPFKSYNLSVGPGTLVTNHCITRAISDHAISYMTSAQVANTTKQPTFELFRQETGGAFKPPPFKIHDGGHVTVSGEMGNVFSSPGGLWKSHRCLSLRTEQIIADPLFFLHHANLDRVWAMWQDMDLPARLSDISGYTTFGPPYTNTTLDFELKMSTLGPLKTIRDVMDTRDCLLCYEYV